MPNNEDYIVSMEKITKQFPGVLANDQVDLQVKKGEIHALLGENGAGKSTLMSILFGFYRPDSGKIFIRGKEEQIQGPNKAYALGIGMVHQHFQLIENFTVTENIILGQESRRGPFLDYAKARERVAALSATYGLNVDPDAKIEDISVGMQQRVEILKVLYRQADVIILDEPTAVLTPQEIEELIGIVRKLSEEGKSLILITHKLREIMELADRVSVLRRGRYLGTVVTQESSEAELAEMMVGRKVQMNEARERHEKMPEVLTIKDLKVLDRRGLVAVEDFSLSLKAGEILGIAGVDGNGQEELLAAITGLLPVEAGEIFIKGEALGKKTVRARHEQGLAHIPADRQKHGLVLDFSVGENLALKNYYEPEHCRMGLLRERPLIAKAEALLESFDVRSGEGIRSRAANLSGGNQQKAIIARELDSDPDVLLAAQPTRGLDVGAIAYIHERLLELRNRGKAILLISFELEEILRLSDRILVMYEGHVSGELIPSETNEQELGLLMSGGQLAREATDV